MAKNTLLPRAYVKIYKFREFAPRATSARHKLQSHGRGGRPSTALQLGFPDVGEMLCLV